MSNYFIIDDGKKRHYGLDLIRVMAIFSVVLYHLPKTSESLVLRAVSHYGYLGVDIFFVLSGFLIGGQVFSRINKGKSFNYKEFFSRRFYRTLPLYYFVLSIHILLDKSGSYDWTYLFFLQNIGGLYHFTHSWSLCVEEHFYILFPLLIFLLNKFKKMNWYLFFILTLIVLTVLIRFTLWNDLRPDLAYNIDVSEGFDVYFKNIFYPTYTRLDGIAVGTALAYVRYYYPIKWERITKHTHLFLVLSVLTFSITSILSWKRVMFFASVFSFSGYALCFGFLLISIISEDSILSKYKLPFVKQLSILSYSLYLSHEFAIRVLIVTLKGTSFEGDLWPIWMLAFPLSFCFAYLFYISIEKPFLRIRDREKFKFI